MMIADTGYSNDGILSSRLLPIGWTAPRLAPFCTDLADNDDVPFFSPDGTRLFFLSRRPVTPNGRSGKENIWYLDKTEAGWSEPKIVDGDINTLGHHWQISVASDKTLYFSSGDPGGHGMGDIYFSKWIDGAYASPENVGSPINTELSESTPFIAPDQSFIILSRLQPPDGIGSVDLYISYRAKDGSWSVPRNLGTQVNTQGNELCPMVSPDGKFLFFISSRSGTNNVYWMDAGILRQPPLSE